MEQPNKSLILISVGSISLALILIVSSIAIADEIGPYNFSCKDGKQFTAIFIKEKGQNIPMKVRLTFQSSNDSEMLDINSEILRTGFSYGNDKHSFWLENSSFKNSKMILNSKGISLNQSPCRQVK